MKNSHTLMLALAAFLLSAAGCSPIKPKEFKEIVAESVKDEDLQSRPLKSAMAITVTVDEERKVFLQGENVGTVEDVSRLKERLAQTFAERGRGRAGRSGAENKPPAGGESSDSKAVFLCAPPAVADRELYKVVVAIKDAGGGPVGLSRTCDTAP